MTEKNVSLDDCYAKNESIVSRQIAGEAVLVPIRQNIGDLDAIYALNETAAFVWAQIDGQVTLRQVLAKLVSEFDVDEGEAERDLLELVTDLRNIGALRDV